MKWSVNRKTADGKIIHVGTFDTYKEAIYIMSDLYEADRTQPPEEHSFYYMEEIPESKT